MLNRKTLSIQSSERSGVCTLYPPVLPLFVGKQFPSNYTPLSGFLLSPMVGVMSARKRYSIRLHMADVSLGRMFLHLVFAMRAGHWRSHCDGIRRELPWGPT